MLRKRCSKSTKYIIGGAIVGTLTLGALSGLTLFSAERVSKQLEKSLNDFITALINKNITIPGPTIDVNPPSIAIPVDLSTAILVNVFQNFLQEAGLDIPIDAIIPTNLSFSTTIHTPSNVHFSVKVNDMSFSLLALIGASLTTIQSNISTVAHDFNIALLVLGFMFSLLIANAVFDKFLICSRGARDENSDHDTRPGLA